MRVFFVTVFIVFTDFRHVALLFLLILLGRVWLYEQEFSGYTVVTANDSAT